MEHCVEGPTVEDSMDHYILCELCAYLHGCVNCNVRLNLAVNYSHDDGGAGVQEALFSLSLVQRCT